MQAKVPSFEDRLRGAVASYWRCLDWQAAKQGTGPSSDRGRRSGVTGGKQMDGFCDLARWVLVENGLPDASIFAQQNRELPGFFRATKTWDLIVVHEGHLIAALELKSQRGPSFGNNFNNRTEEALGNASDLWTAYREGAFGADRPRPWVGLALLLEDCPASRRPVAVTEPHFSVFPDFRDASYAKRYELLLRKLLLEKHYDGGALVLATEAGGRGGDFTEPSPLLSMRSLLVGLAGHAATYLARL
ncbi:MAG: restriction endonuclease [Proteobacteria bacterium]|nr:restriction endonuclease [Pseudomonadota bacterium]